MGLFIVPVLLAAVGIFGTLVSVPHLVPLTICLCAVALFGGLCTTAVGGWFGDPLPASKKDALGAWQIPLAYMQYLDGHAYAFGGVAGSFITDAVLSGAASVVLGLVYWRFAARPVAA